MEAEVRIALTLGALQATGITTLLLSRKGCPARGCLDSAYCL